MSKVTKRKHVMNEALCDDYELPKPNQTIVKVLRSRGNNLHEVTTAAKEEYLVSMPTKFRKNIWVKRGDYVLVEPILEGDKVKAEIVKIMNKDSIKYYRQNKMWPLEFEDAKKTDIGDNNGSDSELFQNTNRDRKKRDSTSSSSTYSTTSSGSKSSSEDEDVDNRTDGESSNDIGHGGIYK